MLRFIVAATPVIGVILLSLLVPLIIAKAGIGAGVLCALILSSLWFVAMLRTSEMPH